MKNDEQSLPFAIVPVEVMMDTRLTLETMRVLVTLYSFRNKNTGLAFPSREAISERCGMHPSNISDATTKLVELGWLCKEKGGYSFSIPKAVSEIAEANKARALKWKINRRPSIPSKVRKYVFERDAYRCVKCHSYKDLCVDHKHPWSLGGSNEPDNLQTLCWDCNSEKSNKVEV